MKINELRRFLLDLDKWVRKNPHKIGKPIRTKHFLEDMSFIVHWLDDERVNLKIQTWRHESIQKSLVKIFGIKNYAKEINEVKE